MLKETIKRISHMMFLNRCQIPGYYRLSKSNNGTVKQWSYNSNSKSKPKKKIGLLAKMRPDREYLNCLIRCTLFLYKKVNFSTRLNILIFFPEMSLKHS